MRPQVVVQSATGTTNAIPVDRVQKPTNISLVAKINGTATATVEFTTDDVLAGNTPTWLPVTGLTGITANAAGNIAFPVTAVRVSNNGTGTTTLVILQTS